MNNDQREVCRKLRILQHADKIGDVSKTCRYFGIGRASFYRWRQAHQNNGEAGLTNARSVPHNHPQRPPHRRLLNAGHCRRSRHHSGPA